ncbi:MAG: hypothetical protein ABJ242_13035 [Marinomonas sp.]
MRHIHTAIIGVLAVTAWSPIAAQEADTASSGGANYLIALKACQTLSEDSARLACFDKAVGSMVTANAAGEVQVVDKEDVEKTRRSLFGFALPKIALFGGDDDSKEGKKKRNLLETTITSVSYRSRKIIFFTTDEGATWRISNAPPRLRTVKAGQTVVLKRASMGSFFIRIDGQLGVKGVRVK